MRLGRILVLVSAASIVVAGCRRSGGPGVGPGAVSSTSGGLVVGSGVGPAALASVAPSDGLGSPYSGEVVPDPLAERLCDVLHGMPARRAAACCGRTASSGLRDLCVRVVTASLRSGAVEIAPEAIERCSAAMSASLDGCDWVTPSMPAAPEACLGLFVGKVAEGGVCRSSLDCQGRAHCEGASTTRTGRCSAPGTIGATCGSTTDAFAAYTLQRDVDETHPSCADFCSPGTHRCTAVPAVGHACRADVHCGLGRRCERGRCETAPAARRAEVGTTCTTDLDCARGGCRPTPDGAKVCGAACDAPSAAPREGPRMSLRAIPFGTLGR